MEIIITGASGLIGRTLVTLLEARGDRVRRMVRRPIAGPSEIRWDPDRGHIDLTGLVGAEAVVHLAGARIADRRWTKSHMDRILESRTRGTQLLAHSLSEVQPLGGPAVLISSSAVGFYGDRGEETLTESSPRGSGFLADVCVAWEGATREAERAGLRVAHTRFGVVLAGNGGLLAQLLPVFRIGLGGRIGNGNQLMSWISISDAAAAIAWILDHDVAGPVNLVAPGAVTNAEFSQTLGRVLRRPARLPVPPLIPMLRYGRCLVRELMLTSTLVRPMVLGGGGFQFSHPSLEEALTEATRRSTA